MEVSSFIKNCPECEYEIRAHFTERYQRERERELKEVDSITAPKKPAKPNFFKSLFWVSGISSPIYIIIGVCGILFLLALATYGTLFSYLFSLIIALILVFGIPMDIYLAAADYSRTRSEYNDWEMKKDIETYKRSKRDEIERKYDSILRQYTFDEIAEQELKKDQEELREKNLAKSLPSWHCMMECPRCGSIKIERINEHKTVPISTSTFRYRTVELNHKCKNCGCKF